MKIIKGILSSFKCKNNFYSLRQPTETAFLNKSFHVDGCDIIGEGETEEKAKTNWQEKIHVVYLTQPEYLGDLLDLEYCLYANAKVSIEIGVLVEESKIYWSNNRIEEFDLIYPLNKPFKAEVIRQGNKIISLEAKPL